MKYSVATTRSISSHSIEQANISIPDTNNILYIRSLSILEAYLDTLLTLDGNNNNNNKKFHSISSKSSKTFVDSVLPLGDLIAVVRIFDN